MSIPNSNHTFLYTTSPEYRTFLRTTMQKTYNSIKHDVEASLQTALSMILRSKHDPQLQEIVAYVTGTSKKENKLASILEQTRDMINDLKTVENTEKGLAFLNDTIYGAIRHYFKIPPQSSSSDTLPSSE